MDLAQWQTVLLVGTRVGAFVAVSPLFGLRHLPGLLRAGGGLVLALLLAPVVAPVRAEVPPAIYALELVGEALVGLALGYTTTLIFNALRVAGQLVDLQTGLVMAELLDPETGAATSILGEFFHLMGLLLFLQMDGHHALLRALADSFALVPAGQAVWPPALAQEMAKLFAGMFALAFRLAAPLLAVLVVSDVALALVARTVPQLNVFMLGFVVKSGLGVALLIVLLPLLAAAFGRVFGLMEQDLALVVRYLAGR